MEIDISCQNLTIETERRGQMGRGSQRAMPRLGIRLPSPPPRVSHISYRVKRPPVQGQEPPFPSRDEAGEGGSAAAGNRVMVVVDSRLDAEGALEWAITHTVRDHHDCIVLLQVVKPFDKEHSGKFNLRDHEVLHSMRSMCKSRRPSVKVEVAMVEGEEKGPAIVEEAKRQRVSLLVLGQRQPPVMWQLVWRWWPGKRRRRQRHLGTVEYCIQNAGCLAVAVRRKGRKLGGYLITTKRHKNFWVLA